MLQIKRDVVEASENFCFSADYAGGLVSFKDMRAM